MPSQDQDLAITTAVPLIHAPDNIGYRLIELPPELVDNDGSQWILSTSLTGDGLARLHAAGRTYALRQKNTSNALMILASADAYAAATATEGDEPDGNHLALDPPLAAIATLHETVELVEEKPKPASADDTATSAAATPQPKPAATALARGKWHEKFGRGR